MCVWSSFDLVVLVISIIGQLWFYGLFGFNESLGLFQFSFLRGLRTIRLIPRFKKYLLAPAAYLEIQLAG